MPDIRGGSRVKGSLEKQPRDVIPRWRPFEIASHSDGELSSARVSANPEVTEADEAAFERVLEAFETDQSIWQAGDLIVMAKTLGHDDVALRVAAFVEKHRQVATPTLTHIADDLLNPVRDRNEGTARTRIHRLRARIAAFPQNAIAWSDLALNYTLEGQFDQAQRAMRAAIQVAPNNRFILRSAARFYIHQNDLERAHTLLARADATPNDPWLLAAEIATARSAGTTSRFMRRAHDFLEGHTFQERHLSELASAVGTTEGDSPTARRLAIRRLISKSLVDPTENSVAQAQWHATNTGFAPAFDKNSESRGMLQAHLVYEGQAWQAYIEGDFDTALLQARRWLDDQPFSSRPAILASQIALLPGMDARLALMIGERAVTPNPHDTVLWNNVAYARAMLGDIDGANDAIRKIRLRDLDPSERLYVGATKGAIAFRSGRPSEGRDLYIAAMDEFSDAGGKRFDFPLYVLAFAHLAYEEAVAKTPEADEFLTAITAIGEKIKRADLTRVISETDKILKAERTAEKLVARKRITLRLSPDEDTHVLV
jgi:Flp pilus assembly protein TadD